MCPFVVTEVRARSCQYLYAQGNDLHFIDNESLETFTIDKALAGAAAEFLVDGIDVRVQVNGDEPVGIQLPVTVNVKVRETSKPVGDTAKFKQAVLESGMVVSVPDYVVAGEAITVRTVDKTFYGRA